MRMTKTLWQAALLVALAALNCSAVAQPPAGNQKEAMKKLAFMIGTWKGKAEMLMAGGEKHTADVTEVVESRLDGLALVVEGKGVIKGEGGEELVVHHALGMILYDTTKQKYVMRSITQQGMTADSDIEVGDKSIVWGFKAGPGNVRYTIKLDEKGRWIEVGEFARTGEPFQKFFSMELEKSK